jgi:hypothetical protein
MAMPLNIAFATNPQDNRPQMLKQMGPPDSFTITFLKANGIPMRQEEWSYFDDKTRFDFLNGNLLWTINLQPMPDMVITAITYDPLSFKDGMTEAEVRTLLSDRNLAPIDLTSAGFTPADLTELGLTGAEILAGDQILLGFDQGKLVYVETFALVPRVTS